MKNEIIASIEFYFKGVQYLPSLVLDLDKMMVNAGQLQRRLYDTIALANNIDSYSYEYEMMLAEDIIFSDAKGLAEEFLHDGHFDMDGFEQAWRNSQNRSLLVEIARVHMKIDNLDDHPQLEAALAAAYQQGKNSR